MKIQGDSQQPVDPTPRNRPAVTAPTLSTSANTPTAPVSSGSDQADVTTSPGEISRYVQILKSMSPLDTSRVESFKSRIRDGSYQAKTSDLSGPLSDLLDDSAPASGQQPPSQQPG
jgi:flagellar biosynthesis anti-sigma factor FlgM